jgi:hypothetical protein
MTFKRFVLETLDGLWQLALWFIGLVGACLILLLIKAFPFIVAIPMPIENTMPTACVTVGR